MLLRIIVLIAFLVTGLSGLSTQQKPYKYPSLPVEDREENLLSKMTFKEKFWQLFMIPGDLSDGKERYMDGIFGLQVATAARQSDSAGQIERNDVVATPKHLCCQQWR